MSKKEYNKLYYDKTKSRPKPQKPGEGFKELSDKTLMQEQQRQKDEHERVKTLQRLFLEKCRRNDKIKHLLNIEIEEVLNNYEGIDKSVGTCYTESYTNKYDERNIK